MEDRTEQARCVVEVDGTPVGVLIQEESGVVFAATHPTAAACDGQRYASFATGHRAVERHVRPAPKP